MIDNNLVALFGCVSTWSWLKIYKSFDNLVVQIIVSLY